MKIQVKRIEAEGENTQDYCPETWNRINVIEEFSLDDIEKAMKLRDELQSSREDWQQEYICYVADIVT